MVLLQRCDQQELRHARAVDGDGLADKVAYAVDAGTVLGDDCRGSRLDYGELREDQWGASQYRSQCRRGAAAKAEVGAAADDGLDGWRVIGKRSDPFHLDAVLRQ